MTKHTLATIVLTTAIATSVHAAADPSAEFQVNSITLGDQLEPAVATRSDGSFLSAWYTEPGTALDGDSRAVLGRWFDSAGRPIGSDFVVNTYTTGSQSDTAIACAPSPNCLVVWDSSGQDGSRSGVFGQIFDDPGSAVGSELAINQFTTNFQGDADIAAFPNGFVVVWESGADQDGDGYGVFGRSFGNNGVPLSGEVQVNTFTAGNQGAVSIAALSDSGFLVVWQSNEQDGSGRGIFGQLYDREGMPSGEEFQVNTQTALDQRYPDVAAASSRYLVVWRSEQDGSETGIFAQLYDDTAAPIGTELQVNTYTTGRQENPTVSPDGDRGFVVLWSSEDQDGSDEGVFGQRLALDGSRRGGEFSVNTRTEASQTLPQVAGSDSFVAVWESRFQDGDGRGVIGRIFAAPACTGDCDGDGLVSISELVRGVNIALGRADLADCEVLDVDASGTVEINELIQAVNNALSGCAG